MLEQMLGPGSAPPGNRDAPAEGSKVRPAGRDRLCVLSSKARSCSFLRLALGLPGDAGGGQGSGGLSLSVGEVTGVCTQQEPQPVSTTRTRLGPHRPL